MTFVYKHINLVEDKEIRNSLRNIYGFGWYKSMLICIKIGIGYPFIINNISILHFNLLCYLLDFLVWSEVKILRSVKLSIVNHVELKSYKGFRFEHKLPVNGQRTRSNARTCKRIKRI